MRQRLRRFFEKSVLPTVKPRLLNFLGALVPRTSLATGILLLVLALAAVVGARWFLPETTALADWTHTLIADAGLWSGPLFVVGTALLSCVFVPRQALAFAGGFALGAFWGATLTTLGTTLGCAMALSFARYVGQKPLERRLSRYMQQRAPRTPSCTPETLDTSATSDPISDTSGTSDPTSDSPPRRSAGTTFRAVIERAVQSPFLTAVAARLFPSGNNLIFSLVAGLSRIPAPRFIAGSAVGYIPQNAVFALLGSGARIAPELRTATAVFLFIVATGLAILIWKR